MGRIVVRRFRLFLETDFVPYANIDAKSSMMVAPFLQQKYRMVAACT
jgi:hypothetical protein